MVLEFPSKDIEEIGRYRSILDSYQRALNDALELINSLKKIVLENQGERSWRT